MYVVTGNEMAAPSEYMGRYGTRTETNLQKTLEDFFLTKPLDQLIGIREVDGKLVGNVSAQAQAFFKGWKLATWIRLMNDSAATAPDYSSISTHLGWSTPQSGAYPGQVSSQTSGRRKWMQRWRIRWNGKIGRVRTQAGGSAGQLSEKAAPQIAKKRRTQHQKLGPKSDLSFGPHLGSATTTWQKKPGPKNGTHSGFSEFVFCSAGRDVLDDI